MSLSKIKEEFPLHVLVWENESDQLDTELKKDVVRWLMKLTKSLKRTETVSWGYGSVPLA